MKRVTRCFILLLGFIPTVLTGQITGITRPCISYEKLKDLRLPDVTILKVESLMNDTIKSPAPWVPTIILAVPFSRILGKISKEIHFELFLPLQWNGIFLMAGGGGFSGSIQNDLTYYLNQGYALVGTDTGHKGNQLQANWAFDNMERQINFGRLAVHLTAQVSKSIIHAYYCADPTYSYFVGCSRGGGQGMVEAQLYPDDFDGIVAGAPAFMWPANAAKYIIESQKIYPDPKTLTSVITSDNLKLLQESALLQCDKIDGVSDRIINDPRDCNFDPSKLPPCPGNKSAGNCLTREQLEAIKSVYSPLFVDMKEIYPGYPMGLEGEDFSWNFFITGTSPFLQKAPSLHYTMGTGEFKYFIYNDSSWDYSQYDFKNFSKESRYAAAFLDATQTDYSNFKKSNGKMILYHGWNDPALSAFATINHFEEAQKKDKDLQSYLRLFLLPGVLHCSGGTGPDNIDWVKQIRDWVENKKAPERIVFSKIENGKTVMTRPVYPYPKVTIYNGQGDPNLEKNFKVRN